MTGAYEFSQNLKVIPLLPLIHKGHWSVSGDRNVRLDYMKDNLSPGGLPKNCVTKITWPNFFAVNLKQ